jgi:peptide/nickel transport system permease protein
LSLARYIAVRAALIIPTVLVLYTVVFVVMRVIPGDPVQAALGVHYVPPEQLDEIRRRLGLDKPLYVQYFEYLAGLLRGDFGESMIFEGRSVWEDIKDRFPATLELAVAGFTVSVIIGFVTGSIAALKGGVVDRAMRLYGIIAYTLFIPWLGIMLQYVFSVKLKLLPSGGRIDPRVGLEEVTGFYIIDSIITGNLPALVSTLEHLVLPALTLGIVLSGAYTRIVRVHLSEVLRSEVAMAYRARGVSEGRVLLHSIRLSLIPIVTLMGLQFALLLGGAVLTETTFSWPGLGSFLVERVQYRDYTAVQGAVVFFAFMVGIVSLVVDVIYAVIDPRIRY